MRDPYANQKNTYLPYVRGIPPDELRLGSLYLDPHNPNIGLEKGRFEFKETILSSEKYWNYIKSWTGEPEIDDSEPYILRFQATNAWALQAKTVGAANIEADSAKIRDVSIVGTQARRYQIKKPEQFLRQQVLTQPGVEEWISDRLSISFHARWKDHRNGESWKTPSIWLVTGVHLVSDGRVHSGWSVGTRVEGKVSADPGTLSGGAPIGVSAAKVQGSVQKTVEMEHLYGQAGERVWCAQFMQLAVDFTNGPPRLETQGWSTRLFSKKDFQVIRLRQVEDLRVGGVRREATGAKELPLPPIDWKNHHAMIIGLQTTGDGAEGTITTDGATDTDADAQEHPDNDDPLNKMVVTDLPYNHEVSADDWKTFDNYLVYLEYQD